MAVLATAKVGRNFRVTIPQEVRDLLELEEGDEVLFFKTKGLIRRICLRKTYAH